MKRAKTIYYNEHGKIDKFSTYINNNNWCLPVMVLLMMLAAGFIESL